MCARDELRRRLDERPDWPAGLTEWALRDLSWCEENRSGFDAVVDTTGLAPEDAARQLLSTIGM
jgi:chloramphenicol 3-O-phosphotransferase